MDLHQKSPLLWILSVLIETVLSECGPATDKKFVFKQEQKGLFVLFERHLLFILVAALADKLFNPLKL